MEKRCFHALTLGRGPARPNDVFLLSFLPSRRSRLARHPRRRTLGDHERRRIRVAAGDPSASRSRRALAAPRRRAPGAARRPPRRGPRPGPSWWCRPNGRASCRYRQPVSRARRRSGTRFPAATPPQERPGGIPADALVDVEIADALVVAAVEVGVRDAGLLCGSGERGAAGARPASRRPSARRSCRSRARHTVQRRSNAAVKILVLHEHGPHASQPQPSPGLAPKPSPARRPS